MKQQILNKLGPDHTDTISLHNKTHNEVYAVYTFENDVFCLKEGEDIPFDELTLIEQEATVKAVESDEWVVDNTIQ